VIEVVSKRAIGPLLSLTSFRRWGPAQGPYIEKRFRQELPFLYAAPARWNRRAKKWVDASQTTPGPQFGFCVLKAGGGGPQP